MSCVLITGASSGIGLQLAIDYAAAGWQVIACGRDQDKLRRSLQDSKISAFRSFDTTDPQACATALAGDAERVDLAILNAGTCEYIDDVRQFDAAMFSRVISTNVLGTANCLAPLLRGMGHGSRIAIVSSSVTFLPLTRAEAYGASKAALDYLCRSLAIDCARLGIGLTLIRPGFVDTPLTVRNDFAMPGRVESVTASSAIRHGLARGKREICFPRAFIGVLRLFSWLPVNLWHRLAVKMVRAAPVHEASDG